MTTSDELAWVVHDIEVLDKKLSAAFRVLQELHQSKSVVESACEYHSASLTEIRGMVLGLQTQLAKLADENRQWRRNCEIQMRKREEAHEALGRLRVVATKADGPRYTKDGILWYDERGMCPPDNAVLTLAS